MNRGNRPGKWVADDVLLSLDNGNNKVMSDLPDAKRENHTSTGQAPMSGQVYRPTMETRAFLSRHLSLGGPQLPGSFSKFPSLSLAPGGEQGVPVSNGQSIPPSQLLGAASSSTIRDTMSQHPSQYIASSPAASALQNRITRATTSTKASGAYLPGRPTSREGETKLLPCDRYRFAHHGTECDKQCRWCSSVDPKVHLLFCPLKGSNSLSKVASPQSRLPEKMAPPTPTLSLECQRRGFNPEFIYRGPDRFGCFTADLYLKGVLISGNDISYVSEKAARDAIAKRGLERVQGMKLPVSTNVDKMRGGGLRGPPPKDSDKAAMPNSRARHSAVRRAERPPPSNNGRSLGDWRQSKARLDIAAGDTREIDLPGDIQAAAVPEVLSRALQNGGAITINLPSNVSVEIAQAYGRGLSVLNQSTTEVSYPPRRRFRSRSASPIRDRDTPRPASHFRERDDHRWAGSFYRPSDRAPYRPRSPGFYRASQAGRFAPPRAPRGGRPSGDLFPGAVNHSSRLRLSPHPDTEYQSQTKFRAGQTKSSPNQPGRSRR